MACPFLTAPQPSKVWYYITIGSFFYGLQVFIYAAYQAHTRRKSYTSQREVIAALSICFLHALSIAPWILYAIKGNGSYYLLWCIIMNICIVVALVFRWFLFLSNTAAVLPKLINRQYCTLGLLLCYATILPTGYTFGRSFGLHWLMSIFLLCIPAAWCFRQRVWSPVIVYTVALCYLIILGCTHQEGLYFAQQIVLYTNYLDMLIRGVRSGGSVTSHKKTATLEWANDQKKNSLGRQEQACDVEFGLGGASEK